MAKHAVLSASSAHRWFECPGSIRLTKDIPSKSSVYADEGTAAHELAEKVIQDKPSADWYLGKKFGEFEVNEEMADAAQEYADEVWNCRNQIGGKILTEVKVSLAHIQSGMFGTCDALVYSKDVLYAVDFKYGAGIAVDVEDNPQILYYVLGAIKKLDIKPKTIIMKIVQPRAHHVDGTIRTVKISYQDLMEWEALLRKKVKDTQDEKAPLKAGEHCRFCPANGTCLEVHKQTVEMAKIDFDEVEPRLINMDTITDEQIARVITHEALLKSFIEAVKEKAFERMQKGDKIEGLKLVNKRGSRKWLVSEEDLENDFGDSAYTKKFLSVAQAEKKFGKEMIDGMYETLEGGLTVTHEKDRRRPALPKASEDFEEEVRPEDF